KSHGYLLRLRDGQKSQNCEKVRILSLYLMNKQAELKDKFKYTEKYMNWHDAQTHCRSHEIDLATVTNDTENAFLANVLDSENDRNAWIGLSKRQGLWQWQWSDNSSVSSSVQWESGQPDNVNGTEDCVSADTDGLMADDTYDAASLIYCLRAVTIPRLYSSTPL
uniref:C-type lectin domain-containing protein n=1 Tax=Sinocyclocheilus anshuiensis TaxID=1608454 RepID=A0A671Q183_9TELE